LGRLLQPTAPPPLPAGWRLLVIDGSQVHAPGATGTDYRLHVCLHVIRVHFVQVVVTDKHTGESLAHFPLGPGDLVLAERHDATAESIVAAVQRQLALGLRMSAQRLPVFQPDGTRLDVPTAVQGQPCDTTRTWAIRVQSAQHSQQVDGYVHAYRLHEEVANRARQRVRQQSTKKGHTPKETTLLLAAWVCVFTTVPPQTLSAQAIMALYRARWQVEIYQSCNLRRTLFWQNIDLFSLSTAHRVVQT
jgi:Transposase DDE domain